MAVDRAMLESRIDAASPPTLRLYRFSPSCVTIGRFQDPDTVDAALCETLGIMLARRPTGGRGVLHTDEVTYALVAGVEDGLPRGVAASYRYVSVGLVAAYRSLGLDVGLTAGKRGDGGSGACYLQATRADLSAGTVKVSGSAQVWREGVCLQHGSVPLSRDALLESEVFELDDVSGTRLRRDAGAIEDVLGRRPSHEEVSQAIAEGMSERLGIRLEPGCLTDSELSRARELVDEHRVSGTDRVANTSLELPGCGRA
jgi:lipoate-protein ligase A